MTHIFILSGRNFDEFLEMATGDMNPDGTTSETEKKEEEPEFVPNITQDMIVSIWKYPLVFVHLFGLCSFARNTSCIKYCNR